MPIVLLHHSLSKNLLETIELIYTSLKMENSSKVLHLPLGCFNILSINEELNVAAGSGRWVFIDNLESLTVPDLLNLIRVINSFTQD